MTHAGHNANPPLDRSGADWLDYGYDVETYYDVFTCVIEHIVTGRRWIFEISSRYDHSGQLYQFLNYLISIDARMTGYNNIGFDYVIIDHFRRLYEQQGHVLANQLWLKKNQIFSASDRFGITIPEWKVEIRQLDLMKIHHFDNVARATSLKVLEFQMRAADIGEMPGDPDQPLPLEQIPELIKYNAHDVSETINFHIHSLELINMRAELSEKYDMDMTNFNDTKIGKQFFIKRLEQEIPGICFERVGNKKQPRQTHRDTINLGDVIFPYVSFDARGPFQPVLNQLRNTTISGTNVNAPPELKNLQCTNKGFTFHFGAGGIHGSVSNETHFADHEYDIVDLDVKGYYPSIAVANTVFPAHLSERFCKVYSEILTERDKFVKYSPENAMYKLSGNGVYGDSANKYGPFYDTQYTMTITVNGQLLLSMFAEAVQMIPGAKLLQINTDGLSVKILKKTRYQLNGCVRWWQNLTHLTLEEVEYGAMYIRDVNNYMAVDTAGEIVKRKGAYQWKTDKPTNLGASRVWHQDWSALIVPRACEAVLTQGADLATFVRSHPDPWDFMLRAKVNRTSRLHYGEGGPELPKVTRYHMATDGAELIKVMPPLRGKTNERLFRVNVGQPVNVCNHVAHFDWSRMNYDYYIHEAQKLIDGVGGSSAEIFGK